MYKTEEIFKLLSSENKALKDDNAYKSGQEGLLRAFYFFRWCNKSDVPDTNVAAAMFAGGKIPEEIAEHYCTALVMIDNYHTAEPVKDALREVDRLTREKSDDKGVLEVLHPAKVQRRILKKVHKSFGEAIEALNSRMTMLSTTARNVRVIMAVLLIVNAALAITGVYGRLLGSVFPGAPNPGYLAAGVLFVVPALAILFFNRHKLLEFKKEGPGYPGLLETMKKGFEEFGRFLSDKKINVKG